MNIALLLSCLISLTFHTDKVFWTQYYMYKSFMSDSPIFIINRDRDDFLQIKKTINCRKIEIANFTNEKNIINGQLVIHTTYKDTIWKKFTNEFWKPIRNPKLVNIRLNTYLQEQFQNLRDAFNLTFYGQPHVWVRGTTIFFEFKITAPTKFRGKKEWQSQLKYQIRRLFSNYKNYRFKKLRLSFNKGNVVQLEQLRDIWIVRGKLRLFQKKLRYGKNKIIKTHDRYLSILDIEDKSLSWLDSLITHNWKVFEYVKLYKFEGNKIPIINYQKNIGIIPVRFKNFPDLEKSYEKYRLFLIFYFDTKNCEGF